MGDREKENLKRAWESELRREREMAGIVAEYREPLYAASRDTDWIDPMWINPDVFNAFSEQDECDD